ncbi:MAG: ATP-binding protein [Actinomycetota bacterium]|nr:ATP-binding protein [Actinomycetota bacterium]
MLAAVRSATVFGVEGRPVTVEVHVSTGLPAFQIVGLPDEACRESRDRVRAAVLSSGLRWPSCRVTVNLAPSSQRKGGSGLDLAIAIGFLAASGQIAAEALEGMAFVGEVGLDGSLRPVGGVAPMVAAMCPAGHEALRPVVPVASFREAQGVAGDGVRVAYYLREVVDALNAEAPWPEPPEGELFEVEPPAPDLADVRGQALARLALEVAAAGGHHLLLVGPPGSGKTMLAQRMPGLLPPLTRATSLETTMVHSAAGVRLPAGGLVCRPPFRAPHHSSSMVSLVGGGSTALRPGEISVAQGSREVCSLTMRCVIYARLSRKTDTNSLNIVDQVTRCREHARVRGWSVVEVIEDMGESAFDRTDVDARPGYGRLLELVRAGGLEVVLAWRPDRLWRDPIEAAVFLRDCHRHGVLLVSSVTEGDRDPANPGDEMVATIVAAVGRYESAAKSARLRAKARQLAELGEVGGGGSRPFGFEPDRRTIRESEAAVLREAAQRVLDGATLAGVVRWLTDSGVEPVAASGWSSTIVKRILLAPRTAGLREHQGRVVGRAVWPAIIDPEIRVQLVTVLTDPARTKNHGGHSHYLLTGGIARCGVCGRALIARPRGDGARCYVCPPAGDVNFRPAGCGKIRRLAHLVDQEVIARLQVVLAEVDPLDVDDAGDQAALAERAAVAEISRLEQQLTELARDHYVAGLITRPEYFAARDPIANRVTMLRTGLTPRRRRPQPPVAVSEIFDGGDVDAQRAVLADWIDAVVVLPAVRGLNRFDPTRIEVRWRQ